MGKGVNGCESPGYLLSEAGAEEELARQGSVKRSPKRKKRLSKEQRAERREAVNAQVQELESHIQAAIDDPGRISAWVQDMRKGELWRYSYGNLCLARSQARARGMEITRLAGFRRFEELGYQVNKGEKGFRVLAPKSYVLKDPQTGEPLLDKDGEKRRGFYFGTVSVFDISQCSPRLDEDGNPLNSELDKKPSAQQAISELEEIAAEQGVLVWRGGVADPEHADASRINGALLSNPDMGGFFTEIDSRPVIVTRAGLSQEEEARVLAHELGHALMHSGRVGYKDHDDKVRKEAEAESAAYIIAGQYGLSDPGQANYVAHWISSLDKSLSDELQKEGLSGSRLQAEIKERKRWMLRDALGNIQGAVRTVMERAEELRR